MIASDADKSVIVKICFEEKKVSSDNKHAVTQEEISTLTDLHKALVGCTLTNLDLSNLDLSNIIISLTDVTRTNFTNSLLEHSNLGQLTFSFDKSSFQYCDFTSASLQFSDLGGGDFTGCIFKGADLRDVILFGANLTGADLNGAKVTGATVDKYTILPNKDFAVIERCCKLIGPDLIVSDSLFSAVDFSGLNLQRTNFSGSDLSSANFNGADLRGANLIGVKLFITQFIGALLDKNTILPSSQYRLLKAKVTQTNKEKYVYTKEGFEFATTESMMNVLLGSNLLIKGVDLNKLELSSLDFSGSWFSKVNFNDSNLFQVNFSGCLLSEVSFNQSKLKNADFTKAMIMRNVDFRGANLTGAKITCDQFKCALVDDKTILPKGLSFDTETGKVVEDLNFLCESCTERVKKMKLSFKCVDANRTNFCDAKLNNSDLSDT
ncbi:hypothetical protein CL656_00605 [bacterium]|nr:hypothetical protein [bacterium]|tara:strand:+ start:145 stop:1452 length:1308 start_codon:yes stop_codon:yes gene_type:complete